jgi:hypothetical protein
MWKFAHEKHAHTFNFSRSQSIHIDARELERHVTEKCYGGKAPPRHEKLSLYLHPSGKLLCAGDHICSGQLVLVKRQPRKLQLPIYAQACVVSQSHSQEKKKNS